MIPHFTIVVGAAKCGTTSIFDNLAKHPQICPSKTKEPNFFASDKHFKYGFDWYESHFAWDPSRHRTALEASTAYSVYPVYPSAARNMATIDACFRLIYIVRNPIEQIASNLTQAASMGSAWIDPDSGWWSGRRINRYFLCCASYAQQMHEFLQYFHRDHILLLNFEDFRRDPSAVLARICRFAGVDDSYFFPGASTIVNPSANKVVTRPWVRLVKQTTPFERVVRLLPMRLRSVLHIILGERARGRSKLSDEEKTFIMSSLMPDLSRLREDYHVDVSQWNLGMD